MKNKIKFKVIKEYPSSASIGMEFTSHTENTTRWYRKYSEYFEEVKEEKTFTTYDGIEVKEGDYIYIVINFKYGYGYEGKITNIDDFCKTYTNNKNHLVFHSKEKLDEYIISNISCLSVNDILNYLDKYKYFVTEITKKELIELVKNKSNKQN
jgi:hypothetical protein